MIIRRIKISNYKTYLSLDLDLTVRPDQPIILIGGMNGGGKTTLFEAICGALYGLKIKDKAHFMELLNNGAVGKVTPQIMLELAFDGVVLGQTQKYMLRRTYALNPSDKPVESVTLNMNGNTFVYGTAMPLQQRAMAEQQVNKIIKANLPQELSQYFLFDAMQSSELLKENVFAQIIKDNIQNVMGFNKYILLKNAAEHLQQEWAARRLEAQKEAEEYNGLCEQRNKMIEEQNRNIEEQDKIYKYLTSIQEEYDAAKEGAKSSAEITRKIEALEADIKQTHDMVQRYNEQLKQVVDTLEINVFFPKLAQGISNEINDIIRQKDALKLERQGILSLEQMRDVTAKIISFLKAKALCAPNVDNETVVSFLINQQESLNRKDEYAFLDDNEFEALKNLLNANSVNEFLQLNDLHYDLEKRIENYDNQQKQIDILRRSLVSGNGEIIKAYEDNSRQLETLKKEQDDRKLAAEKHTYFGNMLITRKEIYDAYMAWLFDILFNVQSRVKVEEEDSYHRRIFGFLSEFLQYVWIVQNHLNVHECMVGMFGEKAEVTETKRKLAEFFKARDYEGAMQYFLAARKARPDLLMEASDITGELHLCMEIIAIAGLEQEKYGTNLLDRCNDFAKLMHYGNELNRYALSLIRGEEDDVLKQWVRENQVSDVALESAIAVMRATE